MNAAEQIKNFEAASKIAAVVNLFKSEFPDLRVEFKPWMNDKDTVVVVEAGRVVDAGPRDEVLARRVH